MKLTKKYDEEWETKYWWESFNAKILSEWKNKNERKKKEVNNHGLNKWLRCVEK